MVENIASKARAYLERILFLESSQTRHIIIILTNLHPVCMWIQIHCDNIVAAGKFCVPLKCKIWVYLQRTDAAYPYTYIYRNPCHAQFSPNAACENSGMNAPYAIDLNLCAEHACVRFECAWYPSNDSTCARLYICSRCVIVLISETSLM